MSKVVNTQALRVEQYEIQLYEAENPERRVRLESFTVNYGLNMVPTALARLPSGLGIGNSQLPLERQVDASWFEGKTRLRLAARIRTTGQAKARDIVYFEGYCQAPNLNVTRTGHELTLQLTHWLSDLSLGSVLAEYAFPEHSQSGRAWSVWYPQAESQNAAQPGPFHSAEAIPLQLGLPPDWRSRLPLDIWAYGQKPIMATLASKTLQRGTVQSAKCSDAFNQPPALAAKALERIQGPSSLLGLAYSDGVQPLELAGGQAADIRLVDAVAKAIGYNPLASYSGSSFWQILLNFCSLFGLAVVPRPADAFLQPVVLGLKEHYTDGQLVATDFPDLSFANVGQLGLRGVVVSARPISTTNANKVFHSKKPENMPMGCYIESQNPDDGLIQYVAPPFWLEAIAYHKVGGWNAARQPRGAGDSSKKDPPQPGSELTDLLDQYARMRFSDERLRNRVCQVSCGVDQIPTPGSTIAVSLPRNMQISYDYQGLVGLVTQVSTTVDRSAVRANSAIALSGVRTFKEYNAGKYSVDNHPLFTHNFSGAPLYL